MSKNYLILYFHTNQYNFDIIFTDFNIQFIYKLKNKPKLAM